MNKICSVEFCGLKHSTKGLCKKHYNKQLYLNNKERLDKKRLEQYYINRKSRLKYSKEYYEKTKEKQAEYGKLYRKENKEKIRIKNQRYFQNNKKKQYERVAKKCKTDPSFHIEKTLRSRINTVMRYKFTKSAKTRELIGCSNEQLKQHLESQFREGMSWENYGYGNDKWNIDHIKPCASFLDLSDPVQQRECFNWTNLRPLWQKENLTRPKERRNDKGRLLQTEA